MPLRIASNKSGVVWNGSFFVYHSLALVNRELTLALLADQDFASKFDLGIQHYEPPTFEAGTDPRFAALATRMRALPESPAVTVRHHWPPNFAAPDKGKLVLIQPWEFGSLPRAWVDSIARTVDEIWVPSRFVRDTYTSSGVPGEKVVVVPNGVNTARFHPGVAPYDFAANPNTRHLKPGTFKFLFVGGTISRKGVDILLDAYDRAFTAGDDVTLIIKDFGTDSFYANQGAGALIRALQSKPGAANIVYLTEDMSEAEIASLYAACDCLVHPYRGEGYGLPIAEAMACGKPTILTGFGAALDFAGDANAYLIPSRLQRLSEKRIGAWETIDYPFFAEPDRDALSGLLRHVASHRDEAAAKGAQAAADIAARHTWTDAARIALERLNGLLTAPASESRALPTSLGNLRLNGQATGTGVGDRYEERKQAALAETRGGDWKNAIHALESCLTERPNDWDVLNALAVARFRTGDTEKAGELLRRGIASAPHPRDFHHNLAFVLLAEEQSVQALEHALAALGETPDNADIRATVERARESVLKAARKVLRRYPDKQRAQAKRDPEYRSLMEQYQRAGEALEQTDTVTPGTALLPPAAAKPNAMPRLSLCMIVKNEERFLRNCLESVKDIVDEMVIVDTGSTDSTLDIAREYGAKIIPHVWKDDFSEARNVSLDQATGDWALWMDADEELDPETKDSVLKTIRSAPAEVGAYIVMFRNWLSKAERDPNSEMAVHHACRLFRRLPGVRFQGRIHEQNLPSLRALGYTFLDTSEIIIDHFGYAGEIMSLRDKHARFIRMLKREVEECPDPAFRVFHEFNLGNAYYTAGDMENAARHLGIAAEDADIHEEYTASIFTELATALHRLGRAQEGLQVCSKADQIGLKQAGVEFARGYCLLHQERYQEAEAAFQTAIRYGVEDKSLMGRTGDQGASGFKARYGVALALVGQDRFEDAVPYCEQALAEQTTFVDARYLLTVILARLERPADARRELEILLSQSPNHADALRDLAALLVKEKAYAEALPYLKKIAQVNLNDFDAQARLAHCLEELQRYEEARDLYRRLRLLRPQSVEVCVNLGRMLAACGAEAEAIDCYADAIQMDPDYGNAYFNAGDLLYKLGYYDRAADAYQSGLQVEPEHPSGFFMLGNCYYRKQAYQAAALSYRQALVQDPTHEAARNNLAMAEEMAASANAERAA
jgi:tetratricopeptide (TPR) repeat protein